MAGDTAPTWVESQRAVTLMRAPWVHDSVRDGCLFGCAAEAGRLDHYVRFVPLSLTLGVFEDVDQCTSVADFCSIGGSGDVASHMDGFHRLLLATVSYHAVRAARRKHSPQSCEHSEGLGGGARGGGTGCLALRRQVCD